MPRIAVPLLVMRSSIGCVSVIVHCRRVRRTGRIVP
jgi:hypothetical protein